MGSIPAQSKLLKNSKTTYKVAGTLIGSHTVQSGDTFSGIADGLGLDLNDLLAANPGIKPEELEAGQVIKLPTKSTRLVFNFE